MQNNWHVFWINVEDSQKKDKKFILFLVILVCNLNCITNLVLNVNSNMNSDWLNQSEGIKNYINSLPNNNILDLSNLIVTADSLLNFYHTTKCGHD